MSSAREAKHSVLVVGRKLLRSRESEQATQREYSDADALSVARLVSRARAHKLHARSQLLPQLAQFLKI